jgi:hypothetical protein
MKLQLILMIGLTAAALQAPAQLATSATHQLETLAVTGGGGFAASATNRMYFTVGQGTPVAGSATVASATNRVQAGLIPTLYPRTLLGDANNDGVLDVADIVMEVEISNGGQAAPTNIVRFFNADANTDGQISDPDIAAVGDLLLGL